MTHTIPPENMPLGYLFIAAPEHRFGDYFVVRGNTLIGRSPDLPVQLHEQLADDPHARISLGYAGGQPFFELSDNASGTLLNGKRVTERVTLRENDEIQIAKYIFVFKTLMD